MLNNKSDEVAELLGMPPGLTTLVCFPVAYTKGTDFLPAPRRPASEITYFDQWGFTRHRPSDELAEQGSGSRLRFSMLIGQENNGTVPMALRDPAKEQRVLNRRRDVLRANMQRVVEGD